MVRLADAIRKQSNHKTNDPGRGGLVRIGKANRYEGLTREHGKNTTDPKKVSPRLSASPEDIYQGIIHYMNEVGHHVKKGEPFNIQKGFRMISVIISHPRGLLDDLHPLTLRSVRNKEESLATHAANVSINAMIMGDGFGYPNTKQIELGTAALFHDIGMYRVPMTIRGKSEKLTSSELEVIRKHPEFSYQELFKYGVEYRGLAEVVSQEHERMDGSGYPKGLKGDQIHEYAGIIGILDEYDALIHNRPQRERLSPADAMKEIVRSSKGLFPTATIKYLLHQLSIYPVKSYVKLNNDSIGVVVKTNALWPLKPTIALIYDAQGRKVSDDSLIDLSKNSLLYIKDVLREEDIADFSQ
jgi:HD-GYP domain-containing protein (c-di-GMP phosphodiesterase class II)